MDTNAGMLKREIIHYRAMINYLTLIDSFILHECGDLSVKTGRLWYLLNLSNDKKSSCS